MISTIPDYILTPQIEIDPYEPTAEDWAEYDEFCREQDERREAEEFLAWIEYLGFLQDLVEFQAKEEK